VAGHDAEARGDVELATGWNVATKRRAIMSNSFGLRLVEMLGVVLRGMMAK